MSGAVRMLWRWAPRVRVALVSLAVLSAGPFAQAAEPGAFRALGFEAARQVAAAERKPLLVSVSAQWCSACKELEMKSLSRGAVRAFLRERFVAIQVDGERGEGPDLVKRYHVVGYPTVLVLDAQGREIDRVFDALPEPLFVKTLASYLDGTGTVAELERRLAAQPKDLALRFEVGSRYAVRGSKARAVTHLVDVVMADFDGRLGLAPKALILLGKYLFLRGQNDAALARRLLEKLRTHYAASPEAKEAGMALAIAYARLGEEVKAMSLLQQRIEREPTRGGGYNALAWFYFREKKDTGRAVATARAGLHRAPRSHGLWDSLAEFLFSSGDVTGALDAARRALGLAPKDEYYQYQVARFSKAASARAR